MTKKTLIRAGIYRHYKGNLYKVLGVAQHVDTKEELVVYKAQYEEYELWVRPLKEFIGKVEINGKKIPRFEYIPSGRSN